MHPDDLLDATAVANRLSMSPTTVHRLACAGELTFVQIRGKRRFSSRAVERFLSRQTRTATSERPEDPWADYLGNIDRG
ncbi:hypothetical protein MTP03_16310 [Tsukamurella sp. PLM1]|nr:hypothetical protein MTP03_16310 [Tsukamurella sp. PLM1]